MPFRSPTYCKTESHGKIFFIILFSVISREKEWNKMLMAWIRLRRLKNKGCVFGRFPWHLMSNLTNIWLVFDFFLPKFDYRDRMRRRRITLFSAKCAENFRYDARLKINIIIFEKKSEHFSYGFEKPSEILSYEHRLF